MTNHTMNLDPQSAAWLARMMSGYKLKPAECQWLREAQVRGYLRPFSARPCPELLFLERLKLVEHNPCTFGPTWEWRVTAKGERHPGGAIPDVMNVMPKEVE